MRPSEQQGALALRQALDEVTELQGLGRGAMSGTLVFFAFEAEAATDGVGMESRVQGGSELVFHH